MEKKKLRRVPSQARSQERLERILDAAAGVFSEVGFDAATTEGIAARAGTSIGSVYQFFPNKRALLYAIAMRYAERVQRTFDELVQRESESHWTDFLDRAIDVLADFHRKEPGFRALVRNWSSQEFLAQDEAANREFAHRIAGLIAARVPKIPAKKRTVIATVLVETVSALLIATQRHDPQTSKTLVREYKEMLRRWLEPYAEGQ
ncbi:MAG: TetR/AcrR family transcriptional regulator [Polyangiales bacterium]